MGSDASGQRRSVGRDGVVRGSRAVALGAVVFGLFVTGCGDQGAGGAEAPVERYLSALSRGDGAGTCAQFSGAYKRQFLASYMEGFPELDATTCPEVVAKLAASLGPDETEQLGVAKATAKVDGDQAAVTVEGATSTATVQRIDGRWLIVGGLDFQPSP